MITEITNTNPRSSVFFINLKRNQKAPQRGEKAVPRKRKGPKHITRMASTGVSPSDEVATKFNEIKLGRCKARFVIYKIEGAY
jgi:hypothetical protein